VESDDRLYYLLIIWCN